MKKRFGITFVAFARARRMGTVMKQIRQGEKIINAQRDAGYESGSGFRDAFVKILSATPAHCHQQQILKASWLDTPLGPMLAISDEAALYLLEFVDSRGLEREVERLRIKTQSAIILGESAPIKSIEKELEGYFCGQLKTFTTPVHLLGSPFQIATWQALQAIPYGMTKSYKQQAEDISKPQAFRAVANANGANQLAIIIPCHRIINTNGELGGYGGGLNRKQWLIDLEKRAR